MTQPNPWTRRLRRLFWMAGAAGTFYMLATFALERMRESRAKAQRERRERDLIKSHFTSLLDTMSYTLYALLPTLAPQINDMYPVESTSQMLQGISHSLPGSSQLSTAGTPDSSMVLQEREESASVSGSVAASQTQDGQTSASWSSEFRNVEDSGVISVNDTDEMSSVVSATISLPTDASISSGSSDISALESPQAPPPPLPSKKELWRDLKLQSIERAITSALLIPLLHILTTSQLATLARSRYLEDVKASLPTPPPSPIRRGYFHSYTIEGMGLSEFVDETTTILNPFTLLPKSISRFLPQSLSASASVPVEATEETKAEDERLYLTYSWWILHEGWKPIAEAVNHAVEQVFTMPLKRELSAQQWESLIKQIIVSVSETISIPSLLPPSPIPIASCPLPNSPPTAHLASLLAETRAHLASPDARLLFTKGAEAMSGRLISTIKSDVYGIPEYTVLPSQIIPDKRLVDCLPTIGSWGRNIWQGIPDGGVESVLTLPEVESFAGLVLGDWA